MLFLQVLANLTSVQSYLDIFAEKIDQEARVSDSKMQRVEFFCIQLVKTSCHFVGVGGS